MDDRPGCLVAPHLASDADLVARARDGDRTAFGVLYLRHHAAAWRLASATSGFSDDAELAVLAGFTDVFSSLPRGGDPAFRAHLLTCVRRAALERGRTRRRGGAAGSARCAGNDVRAALVALPEPRRAALWLTDVEAMTPAEVASVVGLDARAVPRLAGEARATVSAACRESSLTSAVAPPPLLGGECQRHWLTHRGEEEVRTAARADGRPRRETRRWAPLTAVATAAAAMVFGLPLGGSLPADEATTVAVSPAVRAYLPGSIAR
ncbi:MAG TPA: sigma factor-like helix-turn-helix DNA-binding protein [Acidimicrobiia bacterium]|jgi:DNA-directed RNA polymerase specialized sigma24 family protein